MGRFHNNVKYKLTEDGDRPVKRINAYLMYKMDLPILGRLFFTLVCKQKTNLVTCPDVLTSLPINLPSTAQGQLCGIHKTRPRPNEKVTRGQPWY